MGSEVKGAIVIAIAVVVGMLITGRDSGVQVGAGEEIRVPVRVWSDAVIEPVSLVTPSEAAMPLLEGEACVDGSCAAGSVLEASGEAVVTTGPVRAVGSRVVTRLRERPILRGIRGRLFGCR